MSSSLPRIRISSDNAHSRSQSNLKFKKLNIGVEGSIGSIAQTKKNTIKTQMKSQRLSSLQRFSSIQQQRQYRNEKIHQNLIQRKLLGGRFDQTAQTQNDLGKLKLKMDQYRNQCKIKLEDIERTKRLVNEINRQIQLNMNEKKEIEGQKQLAEQKYESAKKASESVLYQKSVYEQMIASRQSDNLLLMNDINFFKREIAKLKSFSAILQKQALQTSDRCYEKLKKKAQEEKQQRDGILIMERDKMHKKIEADQNRSQRNKNIQQIKQTVERQQQEKSFNQLYKKILINKFQQKWLNIQMNRLTERYKQIQSFFSKICSFSRISPDEPKRVSERFSEHEPEEISVQKIIKETEQKVFFLQKQKIKLQNTLQNLKNQSLSLGENVSLNFTSQTLQFMNKKKEIKQIMIEQLQKRQQINQIKKWIFNQLTLFKVKPEKSSTLQAVTHNFKKLAQTITNMTKKSS